MHKIVIGKYLVSVMLHYYFFLVTITVDILFIHAVLDTGSDLLTCGDLYSRGIWTGGMCLFRNNGANLVPINGHMNLSCVVSSNCQRRFLHTNTHTCTQYPSIPNC